MAWRTSCPKMRAATELFIHGRNSLTVPSLQSLLKESSKGFLEVQRTSARIKVPSSCLHTQSALLAGKPKELDSITFHKLADETLDELAGFFEDIGDSGLTSSDFDVSLSSGVLTINVGGGHGTYVINKQSPNQQIWFSSPKSGPKRYDVIDGRWRYSHDDGALYDTLQEEFSAILGTKLDLSQLKYSYLISDEGNWTN